METVSEDMARSAEQRFGDFIRNVVNPGALERDINATPLDPQAYRLACTLGMTSFPLPKEVGGAGENAASWGRLLERIGYMSIDSSLPFVISLRASVIKTIYRSGRKDLTDRYVLPMVRGARVPAFAYTDGTDAFSFNTTATKVQGGYLLEGEKLFITGGATADTFMIYAGNAGLSPSDLGVFIVEREDEGVRVIEPPAQVSGLRSAGICSLSLNKVFVAGPRVLVESDGLSHAQQFLNERRIFLVCPVVGRMQAILEDCIADLSKTVRYGNSLTAMQSVQAQIGNMVIRLESARAMLYRALQHQDSTGFDLYWDAIGSATKCFVVDQSIALVQTALRLLGGDGYLRHRHYERFQRDFCGFIAGGGSQDTLAVDLGTSAIAAVNMSHRY